MVWKRLTTWQAVAQHTLACHAVSLRAMHEQRTVKLYRDVNPLDWLQLMGAMSLRNCCSSVAVHAGLQRHQEWRARGGSQSPDKQ